MATQSTTTGNMVHNDAVPSDRAASWARPGRTRAPKACQRCRHRRERCDGALRGVPCSRCEKNGIAECVIIASKRGRHSRKAVDTPRPDGVPPTRAPVLPHSQTPPNVETYMPTRENQPLQTPSAVDSWADPTHPLSAESPGNCSISTNASGGTPVSSYRELSWTALFQHLVDSQSAEREELIDKCAITYLGESFPLSMVLDNFATERSRAVLHHAGPKVPDKEAGPQQHEEQPSLSAVDMEWLKAKGAFEYPPARLLEALISAFVTRFFPLYPIVHLDETLRQLETRTIPWILLHSICFVAAGVCPSAVLHQAGCTRREVRERFYVKTKALFDASYEVNKVVLLQTAALMTFCIGRPNEYWNFWSWHATSVTMAESLGLHRSMVAARNIPQRDKSLLKRLWWFLIIRDASTGSMIGRPFRINTDQCDMEPLTLGDFEHDIQCDTFQGHPLRDSFGLYQIHMAELAGILRQIILTRYGPSRSPDNMRQLNEALEAWRAGLPSILSNHDGLTGEIFSRSLSMVYQHHLILANLCAPAASPFPPLLEDDCKAVIDNAAKTILSLACNMVRRSSPLLIPHEAFPALFLAQVVFLKRTKSRDPEAAEGARTALTTCQLLWHTISESWDSGPWVMDLFDKMTALIDRQGSEGGVQAADLLSFEGPSVDIIVGDPTFGGLSTCLDGSLENGAVFGELPSWAFPHANEGFWTN